MKAETCSCYILVIDYILCNKIVLDYVNGRRTGLVTFCVESSFYNGLLKERYKRG